MSAGGACFAYGIRFVRRISLPGGIGSFMRWRRLGRRPGPVDVVGEPSLPLFAGLLRRKRIGNHISSTMADVDPGEEPARQQPARVHLVTRQAFACHKFEASNSAAADFQRSLL